MSETPSSILSPKNDFVFKQLFGDSAHIAPLAAFLQAALNLPAEEFVDLAIADPNLNQEAICGIGSRFYRQRRKTSSTLWREREAPWLRRLEG